MDPLPVLLADAGPYSLRAWRRDWVARDRGDVPRPCPKCRTIGFFGPRIRPFCQYRACRFCGFWQDVDQDPEYRLPTVHGCLNWPVIAGAPYIWWVPVHADTYACPFCPEDVERSAAKAANPFFVRSHPWGKLPQNRMGRWYRAYWAQWRLSRGRTFL